MLGSLRDKVLAANHAIDKEKNVGENAPSFFILSVENIFFQK